MIILEGPNGTGKTFLANQLCKDLGFKIHKFKEIPATQADFGDQVSQSLELLTRPIIQDRCPMISDLIYSGLNSKRPPFLSLKTLYDIVHAYKPILILTDAETASRAVFGHRYLRAAYYSLENLLVDYDHYLYNWNIDRYTKVLTCIKNEIKKRQ